MTRFFKLLLCVGLYQSPGLLAAHFMGGEARFWYESLRKSFLPPPEPLFGPIWLLLYTMMGIAVYIVWDTRPCVTTCWSY